MMRPSLLRAFPCLIVLGLAHAQPDTFWCGNQLVREGMAAAGIVELCGEPDSVELIEEPIMSRNFEGTYYQVGVRVIEVWTYDRGPRRFPARITVEDGAATEVELIRQ